MRIQNSVLELAEEAVARVISQCAEHDAAAFNIGVQLFGALGGFQIRGNDNGLDAIAILKISGMRFHFPGASSGQNNIIAILGKVLRQRFSNTG